MSTDENETFGRVLALDTATRYQALALIDGDDVLEHLQRRVRFNHGSSLLDNVSGLLTAHGLALADIDLISVGVGPGSFTGLRVGLALAKSFARSHDIPIVGVSSLAALAYPHAQSFRTGIVCPMYDARRSEVYAGVYRRNGRALDTLVEDNTFAPHDIADQLRTISETEAPVLVVGNAPQKYDTLRELHAPDLNWETPPISVVEPWANGPSGVGVAILGRLTATSRGVDDVAELEPNYIRPTDAELNFEK